MTRLTERQEQVLDLLNAGLQAREIADRLDITRNAVYQQIQVLKKKGVLDTDWTPTGERRIPADVGSSNAQGVPRNADELLTYATAGAGRQGPGERVVSRSPALEDVVRDLVAQNAQLIKIIERLTAQ